MAFDVIDIDLSQLFKNDDTYTIPRYQRNYVWNRTNWIQLIGDIDFCAETTPDWSHYVGSMVFERKKLWKCKCNRWATKISDLSTGNFFLNLRI